MRLRSVAGFPLQRLALVGYPPLVLEVYTVAIDFGSCPPGVRQTRPLVVKNVGAVTTAVSVEFFPPLPEFEVSCCATQ